jgi:hypothetical protein
MLPTEPQPTTDLTTEPVTVVLANETDSVANVTTSAPRPPARSSAGGAGSISLQLTVAAMVAGAVMLL